MVSTVACARAYIAMAVLHNFLGDKASTVGVHIGGTNTSAVLLTKEWQYFAPPRYRVRRGRDTVRPNTCLGVCCCRRYIRSFVLIVEVRVTLILS